MKLQFKLDSLESLPEALHSYYVQTEDGKFTLSLDGTYVESSKLDEFRNSNIQLRQEKENIQKQLDSLSKLNPALSEEKEDAQPSDRLGALEKMVKDLLDSNKSKDEALIRRSKEDQIKAAANELGIPASAAVDIVNRVMSQSHKYENDKITFDAYADDEGNPYDVKTFIDKEIRKSAPHFFVQRSGTGIDPKAKEVIPDFAAKAAKGDVISEKDLWSAAFSEKE